MKKMKKLLLLTLTLVLALCSLCAFAACGEKNVYGVKVLDPDGKGVAGVMVQWCDDSGCFPSDGETDANGELVYNSKAGDLKEGTYHIKLLKLPAGYTYDMDKDEYYTGAEATPAKKYVTITLKAGTPENPNYPTGDGSWGNKYVVELDKAATVQANKTEIAFSFQAAEAGIYSFTATGCTFLSMRGENGVDYERGPNGSITGYELNESYVSTPIFLVATPAASASEVTLTITRTGDVKPIETVITPVPFSGKNLAVPEIAGELIFAKITGATTVEYNESEDRYHVTSEEGSPVLLCNLLQPTEYLDRALAELDAEGGNPYRFSTGENTYEDYRLALRGYENDKDSATGEYYTKYCNDDGVVPVTKQLMEFLEQYVEKQRPIGVTSAPGAREGFMHLFPCCWYRGYDKAEGNGSEESPYLIESGLYEIQIPANGSVYLKAKTARHYTAVFRATGLTVTYGETRLTANELNGFTFEDEKLFTLTGTNGAVRLILTVTLTQGTVDNPNQGLVGARNTVVLRGTNPTVYYTFTAPDAATYKLTVANENVTYEEVDGKLDANNSVALQAGERITVVFGVKAGVTVPPNGLTSTVTFSPDTIDYLSSGDGSEEHPYVISETGLYSVTVPANGTVYFTFRAPKAAWYRLSTNNANAQYTTGPATEGDGHGFDVSFNDVAEGAENSFMLQTVNGSAATYFFSLSEVDISAYLLSEGENTVHIPAGSENNVSYYFTPAKSGKYKVTVSDNHSYVEFMHGLHMAQIGTGAEEGLEYTGYTNSEDVRVEFVLTAGERLTFACNSSVRNGETEFTLTITYLGE